MRPLHSGLSEWPRGRGRRYRNQTGIYTRHSLCYSWSYILLSFFLTLLTIPRCTATVNLVTSPGLRHWESVEASLMGVSEKINLHLHLHLIICNESRQCSECTSSPALGKSVPCVKKAPTGACTCKCLVLLAQRIFCSLSHLLTRLHELDAFSVFKKYLVERSVKRFVAEDRMCTFTRFTGVNL